MRCDCIGDALHSKREILLAQRRPSGEAQSNRRSAIFNVTKDDLTIKSDARSLHFAGTFLQRLILRQYLVAHVLFALETFHQLVVELDWHHRLEGDDVRMQRHPFHNILLRKYRIGQTIEQQQMMQRRGGCGGQ